MILEIYIFMVSLCLIFITIGIFRPSESIFSIIGFALLFLFSFTLLNGHLEYESGSYVNTSLGYDATGNVNSTYQAISYKYDEWDGQESRDIGFWLAILSAVGFIGMLYMIGTGRMKYNG